MENTNIYSVESLTTEIKKLLEMSYADIWVEGEVSSIASPASGHTYFTLKDQNNTLKCVLFKNKKYLAACLPVEGERILIRGRISLYTGRGDVQLICSYIEAAGEGELRRQFEALKKQLKSEGLFDIDRKQDLPEHPKTIALITSPEGAVLHDIISTLKYRHPFVRLKVYPSNVQGDAAKQTLLDVLKMATKDTPDIIIIARGGGSLEDLQLFNDETIARAVSACPIPTVSAIGHETDFVITDFVADVRAPTPTAAATMVVPDIHELKIILQQQATALDTLISRKINAGQQNLDFAQQRLKHPYDRILMQKTLLQRWELKLQVAHQTVTQGQQQQLDRSSTKLQTLSPQNQLNSKRYAYQAANDRLDNSIRHHIEKANTELGQSAAKLAALSPHGTLSRGYSILQNQHGKVISHATQVKEKEVLQATLYEGKLDLSVNAKSK